MQKASVVSVLFDNRIGKFPKIEINFSGCFGSSKDDSGIREELGVRERCADRVCDEQILWSSY